MRKLLIAGAAPAYVLETAKGPSRRTAPATCSFSMFLALPVACRLDEAERVGYGFDLPTEEPEVVPSVPRNQEEVPEEMSA
jgi:hypothetical protein